MPADSKLEEVEDRRWCAGGQGTHSVNSSFSSLELSLRHGQVYSLTVTQWERMGLMDSEG